MKKIFKKQLHVKGKKNIIIFCFAEKKTCIGKHEVEKHYGKHVCLFIYAPVTIE
jgi:hypothetical protein